MIDLLWKPYMQWCIIDSLRVLGVMVLAMVVLYWIIKWAEW